MRRPRLRNPCTAEEERRQELVVRRKQRDGTVEDARSVALEQRQVPQAFLDTVELRQHVDARDRKVARTEPGPACRVGDDAGVAEL